MEHTFKILKKEKLILRKMRGRIMLKDYRLLLKQASQIEEFHYNYSIILDYRDTSLIGSVLEYTSFLKEINKRKHSKSTKLFIVNSPRVYVACNLFKDLLGSKNTFIFSSPLAALHHIGIHNPEALNFLEANPTSLITK